MSPKRRLNSRATRCGSDRPRRLADSPVRNVSSSRRRTTEGTAAARLPSEAISACPERQVDAAVKVVPRSTPSAYIAFAPLVGCRLLGMRRGFPRRRVGLPAHTVGAWQPLAPSRTSSPSSPATTPPAPTPCWRRAGTVTCPPDLVAEAVVNYADTAPVEVAEHLAPFVTANSGVPALDQADGRRRLVGAAGHRARPSRPASTRTSTRRAPPATTPRPATPRPVDARRSTSAAARRPIPAPRPRTSDADSLDEAPEPVDATVEEPAAQELDGNGYDAAAAPIDLSDVDDADGDEVDPAELDG